MKTAVIIPPAFLTLVGRQTGYHMALGQWLIRDPRYFRWYREAHYHGDFIIVDNGAAEPEEERAAWEQVLDAANQVDADEVVLPDVMKDAEATVRSVTKTSITVPEKSRCIIPQGTTINEWFWCLRELHETLDGRYATVGIPKHMESVKGGRAGMLASLPPIIAFHYNIHLFGVYNDPREEIISCRRAKRTIRGIDTGAPIAWAQNNKWIGEAGHHSLDEFEHPDRNFIDINIDTITRWCNMEVDDE
jgi:hypothetical protein